VSALSSEEDEDEDEQEDEDDSPLHHPTGFATEEVLG